jgi:hypothetical protein
MSDTATIEKPQEETTDLVAMATVNPLAVFTDREQFSQFYHKMKAETDKHVPDVSTNQGRDAIRSLAFKVTKAKTTLDKAGLALTEEWRQKTNAVNAARKEMVAQLDQLAEEVRKPLTEWEESEKARVTKCRETIDGFKAAAVISIEDTSATVRDRGKSVWETQIGDEFGDMAGEAQAAKDEAVGALRRALERLLKEEADRAELERLRAEAAEREREEQERREAEEAERARVAAEKAEADRKARAEAEEKARIEAAAKAAEEAARQEAERKAQAEREAAERAHAEALAAERRRADEAEAARKAEADRIAAAEAARKAEAERQAEEDRQREANRAHRTRVQRAAKEAIMTCGVDEDTARKIVLAIIAGEIPAVTLRF